MKKDLPTPTNSFEKVSEEYDNTTKKYSKLNNPQKRIKVRKEQMSIVLTPANKSKLRMLADNVGMSASELIAYWIENSD